MDAVAFAKIRGSDLLPTAFCYVVLKSPLQHRVIRSARTAVVVVLDLAIRCSPESVPNLSIPGLVFRLEFPKQLRHDAEKLIQPRIAVVRQWSSVDRRRAVSIEEFSYPAPDKFCGDGRLVIAGWNRV